MSPDSLINGVVDSVQWHGDRVALEVGTHTLTYAQLGGLAGTLAHRIQMDEGETRPIGAVYAYRSLTAYCGVLGILAAGKGYVPLHPKFPVSRTRGMLKRSGANVLVVGLEALPGLASLLDGTHRILVIGPEVEDFGELPERFPRHRFVNATELAACPHALEHRRAGPDDVAYLLFTSGTTGEPKAVPALERNILSYLAWALDRYRVVCEDRASQTFDLTFDPSVHDLFVTWWSGACLCVVPERSLVAPGKFIRDSGLTIWFSVPSVAMAMADLRMLRPGAFPNLRISLFCAEPLPVRSAELWSLAAPNSVVENVYGPTETTILTTAYTWKGTESLPSCVNGIVPIGWPFPHQKALVMGAGGRPAPDGETGELWIGGPQVTPGYMQDPVRTAECFVRREEFGPETWYRTGDLVVRHRDGCLSFLGRADNQVKVHGHRIELQEIEGVLRETAEADQVAVVAWPVSEGVAHGLLAFVCSQHPVDEPRILTQIRNRLPAYMAPAQVIRVDRMSLNANGKIDRAALIREFEQETAAVSREQAHERV
jgi:amino acid adenylation domain-containing protein